MSVTLFIFTLYFDIFPISVLDLTCNTKSRTDTFFPNPFFPLIVRYYGHCKIVYQI